MEYIQHYDSPLGGITIASNGNALTGLWFDGQKYFADTLTEKYEEQMLPVFGQTKEWLDIYFSGKEPDFTPPLYMKTTEFRKKVWNIMLSIPYGETMTYGEIARKISEYPVGQNARENARPDDVQDGFGKGMKRMSAQAVGGAVGHNSISIIIPCHRVVGADGSLTGYAGGIERKIGLLTLEKADMTHFYVPTKGTAL